MVSVAPATPAGTVAARQHESSPFGPQDEKPGPVFPPHVPAGAATGASITRSDCVVIVPFRCASGSVRSCTCCSVFSAHAANGSSSACFALPGANGSPSVPDLERFEPSSLAELRSVIERLE